MTSPYPHEDFDYNYETSTLTADFSYTRDQMIEYLKANWDDPFHTYTFIETAEDGFRKIKIVSPADD